MTKKQPLVTVLMTAYNAELFVGKAIQSILNQTYKNLEIIIVDDHSKDATYKIIKDFVKKDSRIKVVRLQKNIGPSLSSNIGIRKAKGDYIARMDADDIALPGRIAKQVKYLEKNPDVSIVGGQCGLIDENDEIIGNKSYPLTNTQIYKSLFIMNPIQHPACMVNMTIVPKSAVYGSNYGLLAHDLELVFKLSTYGKLANLKDRVLYYRQYQKSLSLKNPKATFWATLQVRHKALFSYGYKPTIKALAICFAQMIVVYTLPSRSIYPLYSLLRGMKKRITEAELPKAALQFVR